MNIYRGGVFQQALSGVTTLNHNWYDGNQYQIYGFEYTPGGDGNIVWYVGEEKTWKLDARAVGPNGNIGQRVMPEEPMSIVANFGMSNSFAYLDLPRLNQLFPAHMRIDYIRIYQKPGSTMVTCDPPGYETTAYIKKHMSSYTNANMTRW
jgi:beta-glucan synthesis-associated protein KRE6